MGESGESWGMFGGRIENQLNNAVTCLEALGGIWGIFFQLFTREK